MNKRFHKLELDAPAQKPASGGGVECAAHDHSYWMDLAAKNRQRGRFEQALRDYSRAVESERSMPGGWLGQAQMLIALGEYPEAELWAAKAHELFRGEADLMAAQSQALCRMGEFKQAQAASDAAMKQTGQSVYRWLARGELLLARRDALAEHCFRKAVEFADDWLTHIQITEIHLYYHRHAGALVHCQRAVGHAGEHPYGWFLLGQCQWASGMADAARQSYSRCLELDPTDVQARIAVESSRHGGGWLRRLLGGSS